MDRTRNDYRRAGWLLVVVLCAACGCQTVRTPEEKIASSNIPREFQKVTMPDYVVEPPDLIIVEVLEALPGPADLRRAAGAARRQDLAGFLRRGLRRRPDDPRGQGEDRPPPAEVHHRRDPRAGRDRRRDRRARDRSQDQASRVRSTRRTPTAVFVDVTAYNSKNYYILGDVLIPGKLPITGNETVLDAINYAGGLMPTAAPQNIRLVRPAPPGACCEQILPVNLSAITSGGDPDDQLSADAGRPDRRLSRPDRPLHRLPRPAGRTLPGRHRNGLADGRSSSTSSGSCGLRSEVPPRPAGRVASAPQLPLEPGAR